MEPRVGCHVLSKGVPRMAAVATPNLGTMDTAAAKPRRDTRRALAGIFFVAAGLANLVGNTSALDFNGPGAAQLATVAAHPTLLVFNTFVDLLLVVVGILALVGIATVPRGRGAGLTYAGVCVAVLGNVGVGMGILYGIIVRDMVAPGTDQGQMAALIDRFNGDPLVG